MEGNYHKQLSTYTDIMDIAVTKKLLLRSKAFTYQLSSLTFHFAFQGVTQTEGKTGGDTLLYIYSSASRKSLDVAFEI